MHTLYGAGRSLLQAGTVRAVDPSACSTDRFNRLSLLQRDKAVCNWHAGPLSSMQDSMILAACILIS